MKSVHQFLSLSLVVASLCGVGVLSHAQNNSSDIDASKNANTPNNPAVGNATSPHAGSATLPPRQQTTGGTASAPAAAPAAAVSGTAAGSAAGMTDPQIAQVMKVANEGEIDIGLLATKKTKNQEVKDFASMMITEHRANQKESKELAKKAKIKTRDNELSKTLKKNAKEQVASLKKLSGPAFDKAYMASQIAMHEQLLTELNSRLIPAAQNAELKSHLEATKTHVEQHLAKAKDIEISISK